MKELVKIQAELKAPKSQFNSYANFNYRSCEDILEAVKPLLFAYECALTLSDEVVDICGKPYLKATATLSKGTLVPVKVSGYAREELDHKKMSPAQMTGSASSYARKYALNGLFCIDDTKDADTMDNSNQQKNKENVNPPESWTVAFNKNIILIKDSDISENLIYQWNNCKKPEDYKRVGLQAKEKADENLY